MGAKLMVDADSGFLVHPADHQQFANRILTVLEQPQLGIMKWVRMLAYMYNNILISKKIVVENIQFYKSI
jgi:hypothetical protein